MAQKQTVTAAQLRRLIANALADTIDQHRVAYALSPNPFDPIVPTGEPPTDEELDRFIAQCQHLDQEDAMQLMDPGLLGHDFVDARVEVGFLEAFERKLRDWVREPNWLEAREPAPGIDPEPSRSELWTPNQFQQTPPMGWALHSPSAIILANEMLRSGRMLAEMDWRRFEELVQQLLDREGWRTSLSPRGSDGGIDVVAIRSDPVLGEVKAVWQAKRYATTRRVRLHQVRELAAVREDERATKGIMVTTSQLTRNAIEYIKRDTYRLEGVDGPALEIWVREAAFGRRRGK